MNQYYNVFKYGPPIPQRYVNPQDIIIVARPGMNPAPKFVLPGHSKEKILKKTPLDALIMYNLENSLATTVEKALGNTSVAIVERFIKTRSSKMFVHPVYSLEGTGPSIAVPGPHEECFNSAFDLWIGGKYFSDGQCIQIRMPKVWMALGLRYIIVEQLSILRK